MSVKRPRSSEDMDVEQRPAKRVKRLTRAEMKAKRLTYWQGTKGHDGPEYKSIDQAPVGYQVNTGGSITLLNGVATGDDINNRDGRKIVCKSIYIRGALYHEYAVGPNVGTVGATQCRMIIFVDHQGNLAGNPVITDVLNTGDPTSQLNLANRERFQILADKCYALDAYAYNTTATTSLAAMSNSIKIVKKFIKLDQEVVFGGTGATAVSMTSGAIYMLWVSSATAGAADQNFYGSTRVRFIDA